MNSGGLGKHASEYIEMLWDSFMIHTYATWSAYHNCFVRVSTTNTEHTLTLQVI